MDVDRIPFHITIVFEDKQESLWAREQLLSSVCDQHAPHIVLKPIGPLKRDDESLAVDVKEKANLSNCFFATVGVKLADTIKPHHQILTTTKSKPVSCIYDARVSYGDVAKKLVTLKKNKATGHEGISTRLLGAAEHLLPCR